MSTKARRRKRTGDENHSGSIESYQTARYEYPSVGAANWIAGDDPDTDLIPDRPNDPVESGAITATFADADPDTITRAAGSFVSDGFVAGQHIKVMLSNLNDGYYTIAAGGVAATVLTLEAHEALTAEVSTAGVQIVGVVHVIGDSTEDPT